VITPTEAEKRTQEKVMAATVNRSLEKSSRVSAAPLKDRICMSGRPILLCALASILALPSASSQAAVAGETFPPAPTTPQIIEQMQQHDQRQARMLQNYEGMRHYSVVYRGFARTITASMDVEVNYQSSSGKSFRIISQSGTRHADRRFFPIESPAIVS
jgi:hypothetical protein